MFAVIEGIEGSGKSTLQVGLSEALRGRGFTVLTTREPGGTALGEEIRALFLRPGRAIDSVAEAMLVNAARAQHVASVIRPAFARGELVICDRFTDSTLAYQGYGRGLDLPRLRALCEIATGGLQPDLTIVLDCDPVISAERLDSRGGERDRLESERGEFHARVRAGFLDLAHRSERHVVLDATAAREELIQQSLLAIERMNANV